MIKKTGICTLALLVITFVLFGISQLLNHDTIYLFAVYGMIITAILFLCFGVLTLASWIAKKRKKRLSAPLVFAITDSIIGVLVTLYAIYDIMTDTGWFAGLFGTLLLIFVVPITIGLLIGDLIYVLVKRQKAKKAMEIAESPEVKDNNELIDYYDRLIEENNDPVHDPEPLRAYMNKWDGESFFDELQLSGKEKVLEIGSGTGRLAIQIAPCCKSLTLIDISPKTLARAKENLSAFSNITYICTDIMHYQPETKFDVIYSSLTILHIKEKGAALKKVEELLAENGHFVISLDKNQSDTIDTGTMQITVYPDTPEAFCNTAEEVGLSITKVVETEFAYIVVGQKQNR